MSRPPIDEAEARRMIQEGLGIELIRIPATYSAPIFWAPPPNTGESEPSSHGTISFVKAGEGVFAITCDHVYSDYLRDKQACPNLVCQVYSELFVPEERLIDRVSALDIATFEITEDEVRRMEKWVYTRAADQWPPGPPQQGRGVFFAAFPKRYRRDLAADEIEWGVYGGLLTATTVGPEKIVCHYERDYFVQTPGLPLPPENEWLGGISGAPLYALTQIAWRLCGIIYEWNQNLETLIARRIDVLRPDGTIVRDR